MLKEMLGMAEGNSPGPAQRSPGSLVDDREHLENRGRPGAYVSVQANDDHAARACACEQNVLYKKLEKSDDEKARKFAFEGTNEHQIVEQQLQQMSRARNKTSEQWTAQLSVLRELVNHHVKEEESTAFPLARREFDHDKLEKMGQQFQRQKEKLMAEA
jgi:hemerythrin-like domain-containing protein